MSKPKIVLAQTFNHDYDPQTHTENDRHIFQVVSTRNFLDYHIYEHLTHTQVQDLIELDVEVEIK
jgi:hypothetical protein